MSKATEGTTTQQGYIKDKSVTTKVRTPALDSETAAKDIINIFTDELNRRIGIGPIWRQLSQTRKEELLKKWKADIQKYLDEKLSVER